MAGAPWDDIHLWTYVANRDLRVLYFDGMSAMLGGNGTLDTQEVLLARRGGVLSGDSWWDDYKRLQLLCEWAKVCGNTVRLFPRLADILIARERVWTDSSA